MARNTAVLVRSYRHNSPAFVVSHLTARAYINGFRIINPHFKIASERQIVKGELELELFIQKVA